MTNKILHFLQKRWSICALLLCMILMVAGCTPSASPTKSAETSQPQQVATTEKILVTYIPSKDAEHLVPVKVNVPSDQYTPNRAVEEMLIADRKLEYPIWPKDAKIKKVEVDQEKKLATVDFNQAVKNNQGGSLGEILIVYETVNTLTNFPEIERVQFTIEGEPIESITGHLDLTKPLERDEQLIENE